MISCCTNTSGSPDFFDPAFKLVSSMSTGYPLFALFYPSLTAIKCDRFQILIATENVLSSSSPIITTYDQRFSLGRRFP